MTPQRPVLLVVDDEPGILDVVSRFAQRAGFEVVAAGGGAQALEYLHHSKADLALVDLRMPDIGGLDVLRAIRETDPSCQVILMTGYASIDTAVEAVKLGAVDYMSKPLDFQRLQSLLATVREDLERRRGVLSVQGELARRLQFCGMLGRSPLMQDLFDMIRRLAPHVRTGIILGETGTGKELVARALHQLGPRRDRRFMVVNCSALAETLFDSELFGHVRGAFAGAIDNKPGLLELTDGGTLFLDEVGELPVPVQAKLLRVLELGEVTRVGAIESRVVDVQVLAATNRDLRTETAAGRFRNDLFYRLNIVQLQVPALRDRREDIPYLTAAFIREFANRLNKPIAGVTTPAERQLVSASWPGNVRELRNVIERACILAEGEFITERELVGAMPDPAAAPAPLPLPERSYRAPSFFTQGSPASAPSDPELLSTVERDHILRALRRSNGNKKAAARMLGLSRRALYRRLERLELGDVITRRREASVSVEEAAAFERS